MEKKLFQVLTNLSSPIHEVQYIKKSDTFYWTSENRKDALNTKYYKSFDTKEDAVRYMQSLLKSTILDLESSLKYYTEQLNKFNATHGL